MRVGTKDGADVNERTCFECEYGGKSGSFSTISFCTAVPFWAEEQCGEEDGPSQPVFAYRAEDCRLYKRRLSGWSLVAQSILDLFTGRL